MNPAAVRERVLLLIEDNPGDADVVRHELAQTQPEAYRVLHVTCLSAARRCLESNSTDLLLVDLMLPDSSGVDTVRQVREFAHGLPIVVLTSADDELALECINAGAQDFLPKSELRTRNLRRALGYALTRAREAQLQELQRLTERYRTLSSAGQGTVVTAALAGSGAVSARYPDVFAELVQDYAELLAPCLVRGADAFAPPRHEMERIVTSLGDMSGGPRDLIDVHVGALERLEKFPNGSPARASVLEARLIALEMMGLLVDYYRVGYRRRSAKGAGQ
ncbi:MAG TPA: response regulator [Polyangiaceae bacterium]|nr:response regulator [Polyangiaceae bacterium]